MRYVGDDPPEVGFCAAVTSARNALKNFFILSRTTDQVSPPSGVNVPGQPSYFGLPLKSFQFFPSRQPKLRSLSRSILTTSPWKWRLARAISAAVSAARFRSEQ